MLPSVDELKAAVERGVAGVALQVDGRRLVVEAKDLARVCRFLKDAPEYALDDLANLTAVDYLPDPATPTGARPDPTSSERAGGAGRIDMIYQLYSMAQKHGPVTLRVTLPRAHPTVASVTPIWRGAEFQEREVYDLYGVAFEGHPDLRRILMWDGFEGHPMRKGYVVEDQDAPADR